MIKGSVQRSGACDDAAVSHRQQCHRTDLPAEGARIISASVTLAGGGGGGEGARG